jgi:predicted DNA-binding protein
MKIQLNSLEALERLIGGDSELEIEVRNNVVQDFAKKHLKGIAATIVGPMFRDIHERSLKDFAETFRNEYGLETFVEKDGWNKSKTSIRLTKETKETLAQLIKNSAATQMREIIAEETNKIVELYLRRIPGEVQKSVDMYIKSEVQRQISIKVAELLK